MIPYSGGKRQRILAQRAKRDRRRYPRREGYGRSQVSNAREKVKPEDVDLEEAAKLIVAALLEDEEPLKKACVSCEREFGVRTNASHGYCKRHLIGMYRKIQEQDPSKVFEIQNKIAELRARPDSSFPPDLSQQQNLVRQ